MYGKTEETHLTNTCTNTNINEQTYSFLLGTCIYLCNDLFRRIQFFWMLARVIMAKSSIDVSAPSI